MYSPFNLQTRDSLINIGYKYAQIDKKSVKLADLGLERSDFKHYLIVPLIRFEGDCIPLDSALIESIASEVLPVYYWVKSDLLPS